MLGFLLVLLPFRPLVTIEILVVHMVDMLSARGNIHKLDFAALIVTICLVQLFQQSIQHLQDFSGQHVAKSAQIVWVFVSFLHILDTNKMV